jgi:hypothetical protein
MERSDTELLARAKRAYEIGRLRRAVCLAALAAPMVGLSYLGCGHGSVSIGVGALLALLVAVLVWRGGAAAGGVLPGLLAGAAPLLAPLLVGGCCAAGPGVCLAACGGGGLLGGIVIAASALRRESGRPAHVMAAGAIAALAGSLGCAMAGAVGVAAMLAGVALVPLPVALRAAWAR